MIRLAKRFVADRKGATAIEYALIAAIVGVGIVVSLTGVRDELRRLLDGVAQAFQSALGS